MATTCSSVNLLFLIGSSFQLKSHLSRNHWHKKVGQATAFVGLIYLITEITFIHARETLFFIGILIVCAAVMSFDLKRNLQGIKRIGGLLLILAFILLLYRQTNVLLQPELGQYLQALRAEMLNQLMRGWQQFGLSSLVGLPQLPTDIDSYSYGERFSLWKQFGGFFFVPLVVCFLPIYVMCVERAEMLVFPAVMAVFALFSLFQGIRLAAGIVVGAPFFFDVFSIVFLMATVIFADMLRMVSGPIAASFTGYPGARRRLMLLVFLMMAASAILLLVSANGYATGSAATEILAYILTLVAIFIRARQIRLKADHLSLPATVSPASSRAMATRTPATWLERPGRAMRFYQVFARENRLVATSLLLTALAMAVDFQKQVFSTPHGMPLPALLVRQQPNGSLADQYNRLATGGNFVLSAEHDFTLPAPVIDYIRTQVPPLQVWFGGHTLPIMMISNQYAPILSYSGMLPAGFEANVGLVGKLLGHEDANRLRRSGDLRLADFSLLATNEKSKGKLLSLLDGLQVRWIITRPDEMGPIKDLIMQNPEWRRRLDIRFEAEGYMILHLGDAEANRRGGDQ